MIEYVDYVDRLFKKSNLKKLFLLYIRKFKLKKIFQNILLNNSIIYDFLILYKNSFK